jgi:hypothetical protein
MQTNRARIILPLIFSWFVSIALVGQDLEMSKASQNVSVMQKSIGQELAKKQDPAYVYGALVRDRKVLTMVEPQVVKRFKAAGYSSDEAQWGLAWSWYWLRLGTGSLPLEKGLSAAVIQEKAEKLGRLVVNSDPKGADILVDQVKWPAGTNSEGFADIGQRRVRVEKFGTQPAESLCDVHRDRIATFTSTLTASKSNAECK